MSPTDHVIAVPNVTDAKERAALDALAAAFGTEVRIKSKGQSEPILTIIIPAQPDDTMLDLFASLMGLALPFNVRAYEKEAVLGTFIWRPGMEGPEFFETGKFSPDERKPYLHYSLSLETSFEGVAKAGSEYGGSTLRTAH